ncbi:hypothetical protein Rsub_06799 [Raphidocelis subcapitata]|uniref:Uncharacterized protein n=1 Tax=Raphidocelis subcapitata TaxID=307507 RepID=A0A2V0P1F2_9CHLO|nr:hypothetical protein Rsub_06799 [Raphidocelis subcapitata]|eukprot:GBF93696.1 hypothetical protein Rsub_06799 [Raphidocelis subcapitata]
MGRQERLLPAAGLVVLVSALFVTQCAAAVSVFSVAGAAFVLTTPKWTLMAPVGHASTAKTGILINGTTIYTFRAPRNQASPQPSLGGH